MWLTQGHCSYWAPECTVVARTISNAHTLRKHAHAIYRKFLGCKNTNFHWKKFDIFLIFAQNIDFVYTLEPPHRGGSNEYPQSIFWSKNKKIGKPLQTPAFLYKSGV